MKAHVLPEFLRIGLDFVEGLSQFSSQCQELAVVEGNEAARAATHGLEHRTHVKDPSLFNGKLAANFEPVAAGAILVEE